MTTNQDAVYPIPLTILTGFLGAGKTTLLNNILHAEHGLRVAVVVNDFGAINIDSQLVVDVNDDTIELSNGCICCTIRGDLLNAMVGVAKRDNPPEYIIIEASGVSDPLEIAMTFKQPALQSLIQVDSVLTIVDVEQIRSLERENETLAVLQVGAADIVVANKVDLVSQDELEAVKQWIRSIIPQARILEAAHGRVPLELILGVGKFDPARLVREGQQEIHVHAVGGQHDHDHDHAQDHTLVFSTWSWTTEQPLSFKALKRTVAKLPANIFRAKGIVNLVDDPAHVGVLQVVGKRANFSKDRPWGERRPYSQIVVIGEHDTLDGADLQRRFEACIAENAGSGLERITNTVLSWIRGDN